jgi:hypothetical protein
MRIRINSATFCCVVSVFGGHGGEFSFRGGFGLLRG